jgi:hypothetical protein
MPKVVYGILGVHRSHQIEVPDPARDAETGRPDACTLCHQDRSPGWAARAQAELWGRPRREPQVRLDGAPLDLPDAIASLHAGDPVQRVVYASALGNPETAIPAGDRAFTQLHLMELLTDDYPSVRRTARQSLLRLEVDRPTGLRPRIEAFPVHTEGADAAEAGQARARQSAAIIEAFQRHARDHRLTLRPGALVQADFSLDRPGIAALRARQASRAISIGE